MSTLLDPKIIKNVSETVFKRFPEVSGAKPTIRKQSLGKNLPGSDTSNDGAMNYLLTYRRSVEIAHGKKMERWVRVVVNNQGKILKMSTSR